MQYLLFVIIKLFPYELAKLPCDMQPLHLPEWLPRLLIVAAKCKRFCFSTTKILILKATVYLLTWKGPIGGPHRSQTLCMFQSKPILGIVITSVKFTLFQN